MSNSYTLISVQPTRSSKEPLDQWKHYMTLIKKFKTLNKENLANHPIIITLPEYALGNKTKQNIEDHFDDVFDSISQFCIENEINLISGSYAHKVEGGWKNRLLVWDKNGRIISEYDKKYLFNFERKNNFIPGDKSGIISFMLEKLKLKLLICSDLWFPEEIRNILNERLDILIVPAMSVVPKHDLISYGRWLWHSLAITRSRENVIPVVVSDWAVQKFGDSWTCGTSSIINPSIRWTNEIEYNNAFNHFQNGEEGIIYSIINRDKIEEYKNYRQKAGLLPEF